MAEANKPTSSELQIYNQNSSSSPFIKISIPASAVTAATLAGSLAYSATNASMSALSTATEIGINGVGFLVGKTAGVLVSPIIGTTIAASSGFAATAAKETIQAKGKLVSIATGSLAGAGAAIAVTAGSYLFSGLQSIGESIVTKLHNWARESQYSEQPSQEQVIWGMNAEPAIKSPTQDIEVFDEELLPPSPHTLSISPSLSLSNNEDSTEFMKKVEKMVEQLETESHPQP
jgi:hypothetical protein